MIIDITINSAVLVGLMIAIVEAIKYTKRIPETYMPLTAFVLGVLISILANNEVSNTSILVGLIMGATAAGSYDVLGKPVIAKITNLTK